MKCEKSEAKHTQTHGPSFPPSEPSLVGTRLSLAVRPQTYQNSPLHLASGVPGLTGPSSSALRAWLYLALSFFASCASEASATRRIVSDPA